MIHLQPCTRQSERHVTRHASAAWSPGPGMPLGKAVLRDQSTTGVGLIIPRGSRPAMGDAIRIMVRGAQTPRRARVVRVAERETGSALVGCRWISNETPAQRTGHRRAAHQSRAFFGQ